MNTFKFIWQSKLSVRKKVVKYNAFVWSKGRWSLHLFPMSKANRTVIDGAQARHLRRITGIPAAYISRISHTAVRVQAKATRASTDIFRSQLNWLGHILRKPPTDPLRVILFGPAHDLYGYRPRYGRNRRGRPNQEWAEALFTNIQELTQIDRYQVYATCQDRIKFKALVERLCTLHQLQ